MQVSALGLLLSAPAAIPALPTKIGRAATDFEALLIEQMLKAARESTTADSGDSDGADNNAAVLELGEQQYAQSLAHSGGLGIAKMVVVGLSKDANR